MPDRRSRIVTARLSVPYSGVDSASTVSLPLLVFGGCTAGFANPDPDGLDPPSLRSPQSVYRECLVRQWIDLSWPALCGFPGRTAPQRCRGGRTQKQLRYEDKRMRIAKGISFSRWSFFPFFPRRVVFLMAGPDEA